MKLALLFAAALAAGPARAVTTYEFSFEGRQTHFFDAWECPSMVCSVPLIMLPWLGEFSVTAPDGDGVLDVTGLSLTNEGDAGIAVSSSGRSPPFSDLTSLVVTVTDGMVTSLTGLAPATDELRTLYSFGGMGISFEAPAEHHFGESFGSAVTTQLAVSAVPEPGVVALLLAGLAATAAWSRRRPAQAL